MNGRTKTILRLFGAGGAVSLAAVGALHLPAVRTMFGMSACPWEGKPATARQLEDQRAKNAEQQRTATIAKARPAYGFSLDKTTKAEARAWAAQQALTCKEVQRGLALDCESSPRDVLFRFDPAERLVEVDVMHAPQAPAKAAEQTSAVAAAVTAAAGAPATERGEASEAALSQGNWSQASFEYRFADYAADVSATSRGPQGVVVRERYRSLTPSGPSPGDRQATR